MQAGGKTKRTSVSKAHPCPVCEGDHKCSTGDDGSIFCGRRGGPVSGFVYLNQCRGDDQFAVYRREDDPRLQDEHNNGNGNGNGKRNGHTSSGGTAIDWESRARNYARLLPAVKRQELADTLGLPETALSAIPIGFLAGDQQHAACWTFPEVDGTGRTIGINRRFEDGSKKQMAGGQRGLAVPVDWHRFDGPVFCPEGHSDTLALTAMGLPAVGRPNNTAGAGMLAELLKDVAKERMIVVLAERDAKDDGRWPGLEGAKKVAGELQERLNRPVHWSLPPAGSKDVRQWVTHQVAATALLDEWQELGPRFLAALEGKYQAAGPAKAEPPGSFRWSPIDSRAFAAADYRLHWLVKRLLVAGQPAIVGGPRKALKTGLMVDLGVSLASGTPFLHSFDVYRPLRVALLSGESGEYTLQKTAERVCQARGLDLASLFENLVWQFRLPQLANPDHLAILRDGLASFRIEVLIFDPLYLALLSGQGSTAPRPENLFEMGPLFLAITQACLSVGCTPVLIHHTKRASAVSTDPLDLDDLAYAGVAEFARQWWLISRREKYDPDTGHSKLWLNVGGSAGHGGVWSVDVEEGVMDEHFGGRTWEVSVLSARETRQGKQDEQATDRSEKRRAQERADDAAVLIALDTLTARGQPIATRIRDASGLTSVPRFNRAKERLLMDEIIEEFEIDATIGNGAKRTAVGLRRKRIADAS